MFNLPMVDLRQVAADYGPFEGHGLANHQGQHFVQRGHEDHVCGHVEAQHGLGGGQGWSPWRLDAPWVGLMGPFFWGGHV